MELRGEKAPGASKPDPKAVFAQFWVTQNGGARRKILVPVVLTYASDCTQPSKCTLVVENADSIAQCLR
jgi:hypothetical protein